MTFKTIDPSTLPKRATFGKEPTYSDAEINDAMALLLKGQGVSDGVEYDQRPAARNKAGSLRAALKKRPGAPITAAQTVEVKSGKTTKWVWWVIPKPMAAAHV